MDLFYILAIIALILFSAFFSATETAYSSITRVRFKAMAESKNKRMLWAAALGDNFEKLLTTILIGNNIVNIGAATMATLLCTRLVNDATLGGTISTIAVTIIVLFIGEVAPKTLAKRNPEPFFHFYDFIHNINVIDWNESFPARLPSFLENFPVSND